LLAKKPARLVTVALANKLARILWAMMKTGESFRTEMSKALSRSSSQGVFTKEIYRFEFGKRNEP
jgi:hypothetical protein